MVLGSFPWRVEPSLACKNNHCIPNNGFLNSAHLVFKVCTNISNIIQFCDLAHEKLNFKGELYRFSGLKYAKLQKDRHINRHSVTFIYELAIELLDLQEEPSDPHNQSQQENYHHSWMVSLFPVWFWNRLISAGLEPVLSYTEKSCTTSYYRQFSSNIKI